MIVLIISYVFDMLNYNKDGQLMVIDHPDKVKLEMSPYDLSIGRITFRY